MRKSTKNYIVPELIVDYLREYTNRLEDDIRDCGITGKDFHDDVLLANYECLRETIEEIESCNTEPITED